MIQIRRGGLVAKSVPNALEHINILSPPFFDDLPFVFLRPTDGRCEHFAFGARSPHFHAAR